MAAPCQTAPHRTHSITSTAVLVVVVVVAAATFGLELSTGRNHDALSGRTASGSDGLDRLDDAHAFNDGSKDSVLAVEPGAGDGAEEELRSVRVGSGVGHGQDSRSGVFEHKVLVWELATVDGLAPGAVVVGEITSLAHKVRNNTVEAASRVSESLFTGAQSTEVLGGLGDHVGTQFHGDAAGRSSADGDIKVDLGVWPET